MADVVNAEDRIFILKAREISLEDGNGWEDMLTLDCDDSGLRMSLLLFEQLRQRF